MSTKMLFPSLSGLSEARNPKLSYSEKRIKTTLDKVILELDGTSSASMSRLMTRYKRLDQSAKLLLDRRNTVNADIKTMIEGMFDAEDAVASRIIETAKYTILLSKASKGADKPPKVTVDYEAAFNALSKLVPELDEQVQAIVSKYTTIEPAQDTTAKLKVTIKEGFAASLINAVKKFAAKIKAWALSYDEKLDALKAKFPIQVSEEFVAEGADLAYDSTKKVQLGDVKSWMAEIGASADDIQTAIHAVQRLASYKSLVALFPDVSKQSERKNGTFAFERTHDSEDDEKMRYMVYANGLIRLSAPSGVTGSRMNTRLVSPKTRVVVGDPVRSLIRTYDTAFKEILEKAKTRQGPGKTISGGLNPEWLKGELGRVQTIKSIQQLGSELIVSTDTCDYHLSVQDDSVVIKADFTKVDDIKRFFRGKV